MYFPTSHMKLMRCFNLIIIKITSLFSYLAEFDSLRGMEHGAMPPAATLPQRGGGEEVRAPKCPLCPCAAGPAMCVKIPNRSPGLITEVKQQGKEQVRLDEGKKGWFETGRQHVTFLDGTNHWEALAAFSKLSACGIEKLIRKARVWNRNILMSRTCTISFAFALNS